MGFFYPLVRFRFHAFKNLSVRLSHSFMHIVATFIYSNVYRHCKTSGESLYACNFFFNLLKKSVLFDERPKNSK